jgi:predicted esterase
LIPPDTDLARGPSALRGVPLTLVLGNRDHYVSEAMLAAEQARLDAAAIPHDVIRFDGGHVITRAAFGQLSGSSGAEA